MILLIPRFSLASNRRVLRALREALASAGGYSIGVPTPAASDEVFVDIVIFSEALSGAKGDGDVRKRSGGDEAEGVRGFWLAMLANVEASMCVVVDGKESFLTSDVRPLIENIMGATEMVVGAIWRTHRPSSFWSANRIALRFVDLFRKRRRDVLSGLFVIEGDPSPPTNTSYFLMRE